MSLLRKSIVFFLVFVMITGMFSCTLWHKAFGPKYGCKSNGRNVGAERLLSGEKVPRAKKFRS
jgi:hypothetical protein